MSQRFNRIGFSVVSGFIFLLAGCAGSNENSSVNSPSATTSTPAITSSPTPESVATISSESSQTSSKAESSPTDESSPKADSSPTEESSPKAESSPTEESSPKAESSPSTESEESSELKVSRSVFARENTATGQVEPLEEGLFKKGEPVNLVLLNVGKFQKGEDGKNQIDLDVELKDSEGKVLGSQKSLLGEKGIIDLPDNIAKSPVGTVDSNTTSQLEVGQYTISMTIHDKVAGKSITETKTFTLE